MQKDRNVYTMLRGAGSMGYAVGVEIGNRDSAFIIPSKSYEGVKWFVGTCSVKRLLLRKIYLKLNAQGVLLPKKNQIT